jgi:hypothetical protein
MIKFTIAMLYASRYTVIRFSLVALIMLSFINDVQAQSKFGAKDTLIVPAVVYNGDTIAVRILPGVYVWKHGAIAAREQWTRLRNAVYITYPYAKQAAIVFNDIERHIANNPDKRYVTNYINSKEKELRKKFTEPLTNLSVYQGKVLMKLINRETKGVDCYSIVKQLKGGFTARFWQTVAFVFGSNLRQSYDPYGEDAEIESIVKEVQRMYGYSG